MPARVRRCSSRVGVSCWCGGHFILLLLLLLHMRCASRDARRRCGGADVRPLARSYIHVARPNRRLCLFQRSSRFSTRRICSLYLVIDRLVQSVRQYDLAKWLLWLSKLLAGLQDQNISIDIDLPYMYWLGMCSRRQESHTARHTPTSLPSFRQLPHPVKHLQRAQPLPPGKDIRNRRIMLLGLANE